MTPPTTPGLASEAIIAVFASREHVSNLLSAVAARDGKVLAVSLYHAQRCSRGAGRREPQDPGDHGTKNLPLEARRHLFDVSIAVARRKRLAIGRIAFVE